MLPDLSKWPDDELIAACLESDQAAWNVLIDRYARLVYSVPARAGLPEDLRDDVFQSVWMIAVRSLGALRDSKTLAAWLIRIAQRESWRVSRNAKGARGIQVDDIPWTDPEDAELLEERQRMREALAQLEPRCRALLQALFLDERPDYELLAERFGMPRGSIGPTRGRCLTKLRALLSEQGEAAPR